MPPIPRLGQGFSGGRSALAPSLGLPRLNLGGGGGLPRLGDQITPRQPDTPTPSFTPAATPAPQESVGVPEEDLAAKAARLAHANQILRQVRDGMKEPADAQHELDVILRDDTERQDLTKSILKRQAIKGGDPRTELQALRFSPLGRSPGAQTQSGAGAGLGIGSNLFEDINQTVVGFPAGVGLLGKSIAQDVAHDFAHPLDRNPPHHFLHEVVEPVAQTYAHTYGPLLHGDVGEFGHRFAEHPLGPLLDVAAVASAGVGVAGRTAGAIRAVRAGRFTTVATPADAEAARNAAVAAQKGLIDPKSPHPVTGTPMGSYKRPTAEEIAAEPWRGHISGFYNIENGRSVVGHPGSAHADVIESMEAKAFEEGGEAGWQRARADIKNMEDAKGGWRPYTAIIDPETGKIGAVNFWESMHPKSVSKVREEAGLPEIAPKTAAPATAAPATAELSFGGGTPANLKKVVAGDPEDIAANAEFGRIPGFYDTNTDKLYLAKPGQNHGHIVLPRDLGPKDILEINVNLENDGRIGSVNVEENVPRPDGQGYEFENATPGNVEKVHKALAEHYGVPHSAAEPVPERGLGQTSFEAGGRHYSPLTGDPEIDQVISRGSISSLNRFDIQEATSGNPQLTQSIVEKIRPHVEDALAYAARSDDAELKGYAASIAQELSKKPHEVDLTELLDRLDDLVDDAKMVDPDPTVHNSLQGIWQDVSKTVESEIVGPGKARTDELSQPIYGENNVAGPGENLPKPRIEDLKGKPWAGKVVISTDKSGRQAHFGLDEHDELWQEMQDRGILDDENTFNGEPQIAATGMFDPRTGELGSVNIGGIDAERAGLSPAEVTDLEAKLLEKGHRVFNPKPPTGEVDEFGMPLSEWYAPHFTNNQTTLDEDFIIVSAAIDTKTGDVLTSERAHTEMSDDLAGKYGVEDAWNSGRFDQYTVIVDREGKVMSVNGKNAAFGEEDRLPPEGYEEKIRQQVEAKFARGKEINEGPAAAEARPPATQEQGVNPFEEPLVTWKESSVPALHRKRTQNLIENQLWSPEQEATRARMKVPRTETTKIGRNHSVTLGPKGYEVRWKGRVVSTGFLDNDTAIKAAQLDALGTARGAADTETVYHGGPKGIKRLSAKKGREDDVSGGGLYGTSAKSVAQHHYAGEDGQVYTLNMDPNKILDYNGPLPDKLKAPAEQLLRKHAKTLADEGVDVESVIQKIADPGFKIRDLPGGEFEKDLTKVYKRQGYVGQKYHAFTDAEDIAAWNEDMPDKIFNKVVKDLEGSSEYVFWNNRAIRKAQRDVEPPALGFGRPKPKTETDKPMSVAELAFKGATKRGARGGLIDLYERHINEKHTRELATAMKEIADVLDDPDLQLRRKTFKEVLGQVKADLKSTRARGKAEPWRLHTEHPSFISPRTTGRVLATGTATLREVSDLIRAGAIYLRPAYLPNNWVGNSFMNLVQQGALAPVNFGKSFALDKHLGPRYVAALDHAMGQNPATVLTAGRGRGYVASVTDPVARTMGAIADQPFRRSAFLHEARKNGHSKLSQVRDLFDGAAKGKKADLEEIADIARRAQEEIVKFGHMNDLERQVLRNLFFVYSWVRGAARYAARFPMQHAIQSAILGHVSRDVGQPYLDRELGGIPSYLSGSVPVGRTAKGDPILINPFALNPLGTGLDLLRAAAGTESVLRNPRSFDKYVQSDVVDLINPLGKSYLEAREGGQPIAQELLRTIAPVRLAHDLRHPGSGSVYPTSRAEALGRYSVGSLYPRVANQDAITRGLIRENQNNPVALIPHEVEQFEKLTGQHVPPVLVRAYRADLIEVQQQKDFQLQYASSKGQRGFANLPATNRAKAALDYLEKYNKIPRPELNDYRKLLDDQQSEAATNELANSLWSLTGAGQVKSQWDDIMSSVAGLDDERIRERK